ncbi:MAG: hypothetical protein QMD02_09330, partial [Bacteroidales bacterium]|nr:hypothetical protein [Bacteroidales bacterium]
ITPYLDIVVMAAFIGCVYFMIIQSFLAGYNQAFHQLGYEGATEEYTLALWNLIAYIVNVDGLKNSPQIILLIVKLLKIF